jgi:hypothetical protein
MEFVNIKRLKADLRQGELPARETAKYLAAQGALLSLIFIPSPGPEPVAWSFIAYPLLSLVGVYYCYQRNGGASGARFAERYLAIGWVVGWRVGLIVVLIAVVSLGASLAGMGSFEGLDDARVTNGITAGSWGMVALIYWRIGMHLGDLQAVSPFPTV